MLIRSMLMAAALTLAAPAASAGIGENVGGTSFTTAYGKEMTLGDLRGEVVVLTYWMSDCKPCETQLDILDHYYRERRDMGLRVLAVSPEELSMARLRRAFEDRAIHPLASVRGDLGPKNGLPTTYIIDRYGQLRYGAAGALEIDQLNQLLVPLLRQPQP